MEINAEIFVHIDRKSAYIPFASTVTNLVDLFEKWAVLPFLKKKTITENRYLSYLDQKSSGRCFLLLVPIVGNLLVAAYDYISISMASAEDRYVKMTQAEHEQQKILYLTEIKAAKETLNKNYALLKKVIENPTAPLPEEKGSALLVRPAERIYVCWYICRQCCYSKDAIEQKIQSAGLSDDPDIKENLMDLGNQQAAFINTRGEQYQSWLSHMNEKELMREAWEQVQESVFKYVNVQPMPEELTKEQLIQKLNAKIRLGEPSWTQVEFTELLKKLQNSAL